MYRKRKSYSAKRRYRRGRRRRVYRRRYRGNNSYKPTRRFFVQRLIGKSGFPEKISTKLHYVLSGVFQSATTGSVTNQVFRGNSCHDPDQSGVGNQPPQWDDFTGIYGRYVVTSSKLSVTAINGVDAPAKVVIYPYDAATASPITATSDTMEELALMPRARMMILGSQDSGSSRQTVSSYATTGSFYSSSLSSKYDNESNVGSNPSNQWYWNIYVGPVLSTDTHYVTLYMKVTYYVTFLGRKTQGED